MPKHLRLLLILAAASIGACTPKPSAETIERVRGDANRVFDEFDPMCVYQGPFPWRESLHPLGCDKCDELVRAGLVAKRETEGEAVFELTADGKALYRDDIDTAYKTVVEERRQKLGSSDAAPPEKAFKRPRLCFAKTRFHSIADMLPPMDDGAEKFQSFKIVREVTDIKPQLYNAAYAALTAGCNRRPEGAQPALCDVAIYNFVYYGDGLVELRNDVRYGAWVDEP